LNEEEALSFLNRIADGIAQMFGSSCETVIHNLQKKNNSIISIYNGQVTKRKIGDNLAVLGLNDINDFFLGHDLTNCEAKTRDGRLIKSSTFHLKGDDYHYAFGINFDFTHLSLAKSALEQLTTVGQSIEEALETSTNDLLQEIFDDCLKTIGKPVAMLTREDRRKMIELLNDRGAFGIQRGIPIVSEKLHISRHTIYKYLRK